MFVTKFPEATVFENRSLKKFGIAGRCLATRAQRNQFLIKANIRYTETLPLSLFPKLLALNSWEFVSFASTVNIA